MKDLLKNNIVDTTFVCLLPSKETEQLLRQFCNHNGITQTVDYSGNPLNELFEFHVTIFYSKINSKVVPGTYDIEPLIVDTSKIKMLGPNKDIMTLECQVCDGLRSVRDYYQNVYGLTSEWSDFIPHVSLTYDKICNEDIKDLPPKLVFDKIKIVKEAKTLTEEIHMIKESKILKEEKNLYTQYKLSNKVPSIFNRVKPLYNLELPSEITETFLKEKFDNESIIVLEYMNKPMRIIGSKITYYTDDSSYARKFINEMIAEAKKKAADEKKKKVKNSIIIDPDTDDLPLS